jgi:predicted Zn-dependent protease
VPQEIGRWKLASAMQAREAGEKERGYAQLDGVLKYFPDSPALLLQRSIWRCADGETELASIDCTQVSDRISYNPMLLITRAQVLQRLNSVDEALADCERAATLTNNSPAVLVIHADILQGLGRNKEAVADWQSIDRVSQMKGKPSRAIALNGLAYSRALGQLELTEALDNAKHALDLEPNSPDIRDTFGYLLYLKREYSSALAALDVAVKGMEARFLDQQKERGQLQRYLLNSSAPDLSELQNPARGLAVVRYHRALLLLALGREKDAEEDLQRIRQLIGKEPDETLY